MITNPFMPRFDDLPDQLPIFPLPGAIVMPGCDLSLNIFEPRYLNMVNHALSSHRLIGMIQPQTGPQTGGVDDMVESDIGAAPVHSTGCAARITSYRETNDGRILIVLTGVCRFRVAAERELIDGFRNATPDWTEYRIDMHSSDREQVDVDAIMGAVERFVGDADGSSNVESLKKLPADMLVNTLAMHMPFSPEDKQALVDAQTVSTRASLLIALCEFGDNDHGGGGVRH